MRAALLVVVVVGCSAPPRHRIAVPAAPVLDAVEPLRHRRLFSLRGNVLPELAVRVYAASACAGPVLLQTTGAGLREGVQVELISGVDNVFSAEAITNEGGVSACSNTISLRYERALSPGQPSLTVTPQPPSNQRVFNVKGAIDSFARARLHDTDCNTPVLAEQDAATFFSTGFQVEVEPNAARLMVVEAINEDVSSCVGLVLQNDLVPPVFQVRLASPTPTRNSSGYVVYTGERVTRRMFDGPDCQGAEFTPCQICDRLQLEFLPWTTEFSVLGVDAAGNEACVRGSKPWQYAPGLPDEEAAVLLSAHPFVAELPTGRNHFELFFTADCSGPAMWTGPDTLFAPDVSFGSVGVLTVRGVRPDGGVDPCSAPLALSP